jgi:hypothetical protein
VGERTWASCCSTMAVNKVGDNTPDLINPIDAAHDKPLVLILPDAPLRVRQDLGYEARDRSASFWG